ncbi:MAG TPA: hypothetical protein DCW68_02205 [Rhodospirillaceae bacterium]|nr:MAG: hypothetical protein A2018_05170 [Alphaproteobacteria bacterium GWF2_58_20]HAU28908.1 hypothetical protein [Rhodospirillaceae bacterium]
MTDKPSNARIHDFLEYGPVEVSSGGKPETSWWRRKIVAVIAGIGILVSLAASPVRAASPQREKQKFQERTAKEFQQKLDNTREDQTLIFLDHKRAKESAAYILSTLNKYTKRDERRLVTFESALKIKKIANETTTGFLYRVPVLSGLNPKNPNHRCAVGMGNMPEVSRDELKTLLSGKYAQILFKPDFPANFEEMTRAVCYHEAFGHGTEGEDLYMMKADPSFRRNLKELRADIAAMVGTTRDTGTTRIGQTMCHLRTMSTFKQTLTILQYNAPKHLPAVYGYNIGPNSQRAIDIMNGILAQPGGKDMVTSLDDAGVVRMTNSIFEQVRPSFENFKKDCTAVLGLATCEKNISFKTSSTTTIPAKILCRQTPDMTLRIQSFLRHLDRAEGSLLKKDFFPKPRRVTWAEESHLLANASRRTHVAAPRPTP